MGCSYKAIGDERRRKILSILGENETNAGDIARKFKISQPTVSNHLKILREAGLIKERKVKQNRIYSLNRQRLQKVIDLLSGIVE